MRSLVLSCGLGLALLAPNPSFGEDSDPDLSRESTTEFVPTGLYAGIAGNGIFDEFDSNIPLATLPVDKIDPSFGVSVWGGMRLNRHFAVEGQYDWINDLDVRLDNGHFGRPHTDLGGWVLSANSKLYLSLGRFQPFAKFGLGVIELELEANGSDHLASDAKKADFVTRFGAGIDVYATRSISLVVIAEYVMPMDALEEFPFLMVNLGLQYQF